MHASRPLAAAAAALLLLQACAGQTTPTDSGTDGSLTTEPTTTVPLDTGWPPGDLANLEIAHHVNANTTQVFAVFTKSAPDFVNLAQCAIAGTTCIGGFAQDEDDYEDLDPKTDVDTDAITTRFAGYDVTFGPYDLKYREDSSNGFGSYAADVSRQDLAQGWIGASWGGQWDERESDHDLYVSRPIELQSPRPDGHVFVTNGSYLPIEWVPTGEGLVTLTVSSRFSSFRMFHLKDDGYFELDLDSLGLPGDTADLTITLARWNQASVEFEGNVVEMVAESDVFFTADYANIGSRDPMYAADSCDEARGLPAVTNGGYWGRLDPDHNDLDPTWNCLSAGSPRAGASGKDGLVRVEVPPKSVLNVDYNTFSESASVYILTDCSNASSCVAGSDIDQTPDVHEVTNWFNETEDPREVFIGLDSTGRDQSGFPTPGDTVWTMDVSIDTLRDPEMFDTCLDAASQPQTLSTGGYYEEFVAYTDNLNPGNGGCTGTSMSGADAIMPFTLAPGQTISVNATCEGGDVGLYILSACNDPFSCVNGSDLSTTATENVAYTNQGQAAQNLYLVVDSKGPGLRPFVMGVSIQ